MEPMEYKKLSKTGFISVLGRSNVGKSTLVNRIVGEKVSIVSPKSQTTRNRITAVYNAQDIQIAFVDTPGLHTPRTRLGEHMGNVVKTAMSGIDAAVVVVEPRKYIDETAEKIIKELTPKIPVILVINKIDLLDKREEILPIISEYHSQLGLDEIVPVCARSGDGVQELMDILKRHLSEGEMMFPDDTAFTSPEEFVVRELIREKLLIFLNDEVPHGTGVELVKFSERDNADANKQDIIDISADIVCERDSHKGIIIGKKGETLKKIATAAREDIEKYFDCKIFLECFVKVRANWRDKEGFIRRLS